MLCFLNPSFSAERRLRIKSRSSAGSLHKCFESSICLFDSLMNEVVHTSPTIGSNVEEIVVKNTHFLMWDIGGQESLRSSWNTYYSNTEVPPTRPLLSDRHAPGFTATAGKPQNRHVCAPGNLKIQCTIFTL